jgi:hypothetical protein
MKDNTIKSELQVAFDKEAAAVTRTIRLNTLIKKYQDVEILTILRPHGEDEISGSDIATVVKPDDIVRLPVDESTDWDGCESFLVLKSL